MAISLLFEGTSSCRSRRLVRSISAIFLSTETTNLNLILIKTLSAAPKAQNFSC